VLRRLVARGDRRDRVAVAGAGGLDRVVLDRRGEERLVHERLVDQRDHVGQRGPAGCARRPGQLLPDLPPRGRAVGAVTHRVARAQQRGDRLPDGVVDDQALAPQLDEGKRREPLERRLRGLPGEQRAEQRERDAAQDAGGVERLPRGRLEPVEVERRELLHDRREHRVGGCVGALPDGRGGQLERQRVAAHEAVDPLGLSLVEARPPQHLGGVGGRQRPERHRPHQRAERRAPDGAGRVARGEHDASVLRQRRQELQPQPAVEQPQPLCGVDQQHDRAVGGCQRRLHRGQEAVRRRLDHAPVDGDDGRAARAGLGPEGAQQRRLARARHAMDDGHERPVVVEQRRERRQLLLATDERGAPLRQQRSERAGHGVRRRGPARDPGSRRSSSRRA
jgi:hypothetical protein